MSAHKLYQHLLDNNVIGSKGITSFTLKGISIQVKDVSIVGNILQEWLSHYMTKHDIHYRTKLNTQEFPDYLLDQHNSNTENLLEVKAFIKSPNFDVANFNAYARSLREHAYRLDAKYLIFQYEILKDQETAISIKNIWLRNVWEICGPSERADLKIQWKQSVPFNIRPVTWFSNRAKYQPFTTKLEFLEALAKVIGMAGVDQSVQKDWLKKVKQNYQETTGLDL